MSERREPEIVVHDGTFVRPFSFRPEDFKVRVCAHATAQMCRFTGHTITHYSVAQHLVVGSYLIDEAFARPYFGHDLHEPYTGDFSAPLRPWFKGFEEFENGISQVIAETLGYPFPFPAAVLQADLRMLATERRDVMNPSVRPWPNLNGIAAYKARIDPWPAAKAEARFLERFTELFPEHADKLYDAA